MQRYKVGDKVLVLAHNGLPHQEYHPCTLAGKLMTIEKEEAAHVGTSPFQYRLKGDPSNCWWIPEWLAPANAPIPARAVGPNTYCVPCGGWGKHKLGCPVNRESRAA